MANVPRANPRKIRRWLETRPSLTELCERFPEEWQDVKRIIAEARENRQQVEYHGLTTLKKSRSQVAATRPGTSLDPALSKYIRQRMMQLAIKNYGLIATTGIKKGVVRFNWLNGFMIRALMFADELERKPVSMFWFRVIWPFVWQKKRLMPLAETKGIYCFYSRELIERLAALIGSNPCLEVAAGDGTLARFLKTQGVRITATDSGSWAHDVQYPEWVIKRDAKDALKTYAPEVVICSWPPAGNDFERWIFKTRSVRMYIVIGSRHKFATGNWNDYQQQADFSLVVDKDLSRLVLPPELGSAVYIFERRENEPGST